MLNKQSARQIFLLLLALGLALPGALVRAQSPAFAVIAAPDFSKFPAMTTWLDTFDDQGQFIARLSPSDVVVLENGRQVMPDAVQEVELPLSLVVAINSGPTLAARDSFGFSRYEKVMAVVSNWAAARPADTEDDVSLVWNGGIITSHVLPGEWKRRFDGFDPALRTSETGLGALSFALDVAQQAQTIPGEKKAILLITGHLDTVSAVRLKDLTDRANQAGVHIYVWLVDSDAYLTHGGAFALQDLAVASDGRYLAFTGVETLPDPEEWFSPLRHIYKLTYTSRIQAGGQQTLSVQVNAGGLSLTTPAVAFELDVQPPSPALLSPPIQIVRQNPDKPFDIESFLPAQQEISALLEFPDSHPRKFKRTSLYVDGQKVAENTAEPFNKFTWDLSGYVASGDHSLQVEAEDELGLAGMSMSVPVKVTVLQPPGGVAGLLLRNNVAVAISFVVLAGAVLLGILFLGGRLRIPNLAERRKARARIIDPLTQPVPARVEAPNLPRAANPFPWLRRKTSAPPAYFVKLTPEGQPGPGDPIALSGHEITFGTDPTQATNVLDHPSISPLHARLRLVEEGAFQLMDQNSVAGTWVNYESIAKEGLMLKHGDVVHFGRLTYRFVLTKPPSTSTPNIAPD